MMTSTGDISRLFVDTSAWIGLMNQEEKHHKEAVAFHESLSPSARRITSWGVISETYTWLLYHVGDRVALRWLELEERLEQRGILDVVYPEPIYEIGVRKVIARYHDQDLSYVDAFTILLVQSRPDIDVVFSFDHHMLLTGRTILPGNLHWKPRRE